MKKQLFSLSKRTGKNIYYVQFYDAENNRHKVSTGQVDKESARRMCERNIARIGLPMPIGIGKNYFKDFSRDFFDYDTSPYVRKKRLRGDSFSHSWADTCQHRLDKYLIPYWGEFELKKIRPCDINVWLDSLYEKCAPNTIVQIFRDFRNILDEAVRKGRIEKNPCRDGVVERPVKKEGSRRGVLPREKVIALFDYTHLDDVWKYGGKNNIIYYIGNYLSASTGMRRGEVLALQPENVIVEEDKAYLDVSHSYDAKYGLKDTKTHRKRVVPITSYLLRLLEEIMPPSGYIFSVNGGKTPVVDGLRRSLYTALVNVGFSRKEREDENIVFHSWRYYCNTILLEAGLTSEVVRAITGHSTQQMTEHYLRLDARRISSKILPIQRLVAPAGA